MICDIFTQDPDINCHHVRRRRFSSKEERTHPFLKGIIK